MEGPFGTGTMAGCRVSSSQRRSPGALRNRGFVMCRRSMCGGDDPHAENHISTFAAVACLARHCAMQKPAYKESPEGGLTARGF